MDFFYPLIVNAKSACLAVADVLIIRVVMSVKMDFFYPLMVNAKSACLAVTNVWIVRIVGSVR